VSVSESWNAGFTLHRPRTLPTALRSRQVPARTWHLAAVERHGDVVSDGVFGHERGVEQRAGALDHVTRHVTVVDDDLDITPAGRTRVDCATNIVERTITKQKQVYQLTPTDPRDEDGASCPITKIVGIRKQSQSPLAIV